MASKPSPKQKQRKPTAVTGLQIAEYLARSPRGARLGDIASAVQMDAGQTHRILIAMMDDGWVVSVSDSGHYAPTARVIGLGTPYTASLDLSDHGQQFMEDLYQKCGESVFLGELRNDVVVCVGRRLADRPLQVWIEIGKFWRISGSAVGVALTAARLERVGSAGSAEKIPADVADAMKRGYARDRGLYRDGVESIAAPIRNAEGIEVGAIAVGVPAVRITEKDIEKLGAMVCEAAAGISARLGWISAQPKRVATRARQPRAKTVAALTDQ